MSSSHLQAIAVPGVVLYDLDCDVGNACEDIACLVGVVIDLLALDVDDLTKARRLLSIIRTRALDTANFVNAEAERFGCNHIDADARAFRDRLASADGARPEQRGAQP